MNTKEKMCAIAMSAFALLFVAALAAHSRAICRSADAEIARAQAFIEVYGGR